MSEPIKIEELTDLTPEQLRKLAEKKEKEAKYKEWYKGHAKGVQKEGFALHNRDLPFKVGNHGCYIEFCGKDDIVKIVAVKGIVISGDLIVLGKILDESKPLEKQTITDDETDEDTNKE